MWLNCIFPRKLPVIKKCFACGTDECWFHKKFKILPINKGWKILNNNYTISFLGRKSQISHRPKCNLQPAFCTVLWKKNLRNNCKHFNHKTWHFDVNFHILLPLLCWSSSERLQAVFLSSFWTFSESFHNVHQYLVFHRFAVMLSFKDLMV